MPWRRRWRWRRRPKRRFYFRSWRTYPTFRRRRRFRWVSRRKKKLKRLFIKQWQPSTIRLSKIKGMICLFLCNAKRLGNNLAIYNNLIVPELLPGGGGFSIYQFTLDGLYTMHTYARNWWTKSNKDLPLVRFIKCTMKLYQSEDVDYVFRVQRNPPLETGKLSYPTCQPSIMMMLNGTYFIPSKKTKKLRRGYKKITIRPPELMTNKWFLQADIATQPLFITYCAAASFDHYFIGTDRQSNTCTVPVLNTNIFQNRKMGTNEYYCKTIGTKHIWLWATTDALVSETKQPDPKHLISLSNCKYNRPGENYYDLKRTGYKPPTGGSFDWNYYKQHIQDFAGNPFYKHYLNEKDEHHLTLLQKEAQDPQSCLPENETGPCTNFVILHNPFIYRCRYNPNADNGGTNNTYLLQNFRDEHGWNAPSDYKLQLEGFPLWIAWWGFIDFQKQQHILTQIDTNTIFCCTTETIHGVDPQLPCYVPISEDFIVGNSPFEPEPNPADYARWYPQVQYQEGAINNLLETGPGVAKFNGKKTVEAKSLYKFYFKFGGTPPPMVAVKDPTDQPKFPIPNQLLETTSLQDPTTPPELYLYSFDQRRHFLTEPATKRIKQDWQTKSTIFTDGTTTPGPPPIHQTSETSGEETSDSEKEEETLLQQLLKQRKRQQRLKQRIKQLIKQTQNI
nr:MAG: ORF1 [TTV-like mini virus]